MITIEGTTGLSELVGQHVGYSPWLPIDQERVNTFADATNDHQWIHVDPVRAAAEGPFGGTIAHGYLTLSLGSALLFETIEVQGVSSVINMGADKVQFRAPVKVGSNLRLGVTIASVTELTRGPAGVDVVFDLVFETEGSPKPACLAQIKFRYYA